MSCTTVDRCRCCDNPKLIPVIDLNTQPLANSYHEGEKLPEYPLALNLCPVCFHSQLSVVVDPEEMFSDYIYVSGTSKTLHDYFDWFANMVTEEVGVGTILDIACNDGTQLSKFANLGWKTHGIDPARNLYKESSTKADMVVVDYMSKKAMRNLGGVKYNAIVAQNVFAHTHDVVEFLLACIDGMDEKTRLYIQTSQADMIEKDQFDTIYHEHLSFFSTKSMKALCERVGIVLLSVKRVPVHGGSYIFVIGKNGMADSSVLESIQKEDACGRYSLNRYTQYEVKVKSVINQFRKTVDDFRSSGYAVVGYGAAAKGNTFLNASEVTLDLILDDNSLKWGKMTPGTNVLIADPKSIGEEMGDSPILFIPLAWNFYEEIKLRIIEITKHRQSPHRCMIYSYYPDPKLETLP